VYRDHRGCKMKKRFSSARARARARYAIGRPEGRWRGRGARANRVLSRTYAALISQSLPLLFLRVRPNNLRDEYSTAECTITYGIKKGDRHADARTDMEIFPYFDIRARPEHWLIKTIYPPPPTPPPPRPRSRHAQYMRAKARKSKVIAE